MEENQTIYICRSISPNKITNHYFYIINDKEYHLGKYPSGRILPINTTLPRTIIGEKVLCKKCFDDFIIKFDEGYDKKLFHYGYPIINCESIICGISLQIIMAIIAVVVVGLTFFKTYSLILTILSFIIMLFIYLFLDRMKQSYYIKTSCKEIRDKEEYIIPNNND